MYLLAIICPPLAVALCGKPIQAIINVPLCLLFWVPGATHAMLVVYHYVEQENYKKRRIRERFEEDRRFERLMRVQQGESLADVLKATSTEPDFDESLFPDLWGPMSFDVVGSLKDLYESITGYQANEENEVIDADIVDDAESEIEPVERQHEMPQMDESEFLDICLKNTNKRGKP